MKVDFNKLPDSAKVWIYQSSAPLNVEQKSIVEELSNVFLDQWESHGIPVQGSVDIVEDVFIRVAAFSDEDSMCGRAQDAQVRLAKELEGELNVELTNRMLFTIDLEEGKKIVHLNDVPELVSSGKLTESTPFFNTLVQSKGDYTSGWKINAGDSWLERYF